MLCTTKPTRAPNCSGSTEVTLSASDGANEALASFNIDIVAVNDPPMLTMESLVEISEDQDTALIISVADAETPSADRQLAS